MKPLKLKAQMMPGSRRADGSVTIRLVTAEEISTEQFAEIDAYRQQLGYFMFKPNEFNEAEIPKNNAKIEGESLSQRQRRMMYKLAILQGVEPENFPRYYEEAMNAIYESLLTRIKKLSKE